MGNAFKVVSLKRLRHAGTVAVPHIGALVIVACVLAGTMLLPRCASAGSIFDDSYVPAQPDVAKPDVEPIRPLAPTPAAKPDTPTPPPTPEPAPAKVDPAPSLLPVPNADQQTQSNKLFKKAFADDLKDRSAAARRLLAEKLLAEADKVTDNPSDRFVLLVGACNAAAEGGDLRLASKAASIAAAGYNNMDWARLAAEETLKTPLKASTPDQTSDAFYAGIGIERAVEQADDYAKAARLLEALRPLAAGSAERGAALKEQGNQLAVIRSAHDRAVSAMERLKKTPDDPAANSAIAEFLCFVKGDFEHGLPALARGGDSALRAAAKTDLAGATDESQETVIGDAWWDLAVKARPDHFKGSMRGRAAFWYAKALASGKLTGLSRTTAEKRVAEVESQADSPPLSHHAGPAQWISKSATYTASSVYLGFAPLPNLLDGKGGGHQVAAGDEFAFHTQHDDNPYIIIDLGTADEITRVEIVNRRGGGDSQERAKTLTMWVSETPQGPWTKQWGATSAEAAWDVHLAPPVVGRYVKLGLTEHNALHLYSVKVFGFPATGQLTGLGHATVGNRAEAQWISKTAKYTVSSVGHGLNPLPNLLDGTDAPRPFAFHTDYEDNPHIIINLGAARVITRVEIVNRRDDFQDRAKTLTMWVSKTPDGPWTRQWNATSVEKEWDVNLAAPVVAQYVKLGLTEHTALHLYWVKIYGTAK